MHDHGLGSWMSTRRQKTPDHVALRFGDGESMTYRELADAADRVSSVLRHRGIGVGDRVAYLGENSPEFLQTLFGAVQLGAVFVPVNTRLAPPEVAHVLRDCGARVLIHDPETAARVDAAGVAVPHRIATGEGTADHPGLSALVRTAGAGHPGARAGFDDPAAIVYTSGTTGRAKGAVLTHGNLTWVSLNCIVDYDVVSTDVALMISPLVHVASLGMGALPVLLKGGTLVLEKGFDPGRALGLIERHRVTMLSGVPTTYQLLADHPDWARTDGSRLRKLTCGGSAVPTRILNPYEERGLSFSHGVAMTGTLHENGSVVPRGTIGAIENSTPNGFAGYHGLPEATTAAFTADGWFRSGDLGYLDADGYLFISDRLKDMIISGAENIYPAEVENLLADLPGVTGSAVIGVPDERWGEVPWAILTVSGDGPTPDTASVQAFLDGRIARYKIPKHVVVVDELPRTASGKVRKTDLPDRFGG